jgi:hypothetical protein
MTVAVSLVLGLGVAVLLSSWLTVFRHRDTFRLHWISPTWALCIFVSQIQYWWSLGFLLDDLPVISGYGFILSMSQAVILFVAGGLILPQESRGSEDDLAEYFGRNGRWGVLAYGLFWVGAFVHNVTVHGTPVGLPLHSTVVVLAVASFLAATVRRTRSIATVLAVLALLANTAWPRPAAF